MIELKEIKEVFETFEKEELVEIISVLCCKLQENGIRIGSIESPNRMKIQYITSDEKIHETTREDGASWYDRVVLDFSNFRKTEE